jgi:hypothetical protein
VAIAVEAPESELNGAFCVAPHSHESIQPYPTDHQRDVLVAKDGQLWDKTRGDIERKNRFVTRRARGSYFADVGIGKVPSLHDWLPGKLSPDANAEI